MQLKNTLIKERSSYNDVWGQKCMILIYHLNSPPGHALTIISTVHDLKKKYGHKLEFTTKPCKRRKIEPDNTSSSSTDVATDESTNITENDIPAIKSDIRKKVHKRIKRI